MKYVFILLTALSFMLIWVFFFIGDSYHAALSAMACAVSAFIVTAFNQ